MRIYEIIESNLYHFMYPKKAINVFSTNQMKANWIHNIPGLGETKGNSFTRNKHFSGGVLNDWIRITIDKNKLSQTNKIIPLDAERIHQYTNKSWNNRKNPPKFSDIYQSDRNKYGSNIMAEEFVLGNINNLNRIIKKIEIVNDDSNQEVNRKSTELAKEYANKYNIEFIDHRPKKIDYYDDE